MCPTSIKKTKTKNLQLRQHYDRVSHRHVARTRPTCPNGPTKFREDLRDTNNPTCLEAQVQVHTLVTMFPLLSSKAQRRLPLGLELSTKADVNLVQSTGAEGGDWVLIYSQWWCRMANLVQVNRSDWSLGTVVLDVTYM